jgi:hypothetical protein
MSSPAHAGLIVRFYIENQENPIRSQAEGRPIFDEVECVSIRVIGSRDEVVHLVTDELRERFRDIYQTFKYDQSRPITGTPLEEWPPASKSFIEEVRAFGIRSVEHLAQVDDGFAMSRLGMLTMREKARAFIENAKSNAVPAALAAENEALKRQMAELTARMEAFMSASGADEPKKPGRGRPRRAETVETTDELETSE